MVCHIVRFKWRPVRPFENIIAFLIGAAELTAVFFRLCLGGEEDAAGFGGQREAAAAALRLELVLLDACHHLTDGVPNQQAVVVKVHAIPFQAQNLAAAQTVQGGYFDQRQHGVIFHNGKELVKLFSAVKRGFIAVMTGKLHIVTGIVDYQTILYRF